MEFEEIALHDDGPHTSIVHKFPLHDSAGKIYAIGGIVTDITDRKRTEAERHRLLQDKALLLDSTGEGIWGIDLEGNCTFINKSAVQMLGYGPEEVLGKNMHTIVHHTRPNGLPYPAEECPINGACRAGQSYRSADEVVWRRDGTALPVEYATYPIIEDGVIKGAVVTVTDITDRKRAEDQVKQSLQQVRLLAHRLEAVREEERARIAREIHDELGVTLTCLKFDLARLSAMASDSLTGEGLARMKDKIQSISRQTDGTITQVQRIATELRPGILDDLGLVAALEWQTHDFQCRTRIDCVFRSRAEDIPLDKNRATAIFRICQEALTNIGRHAQATMAAIELSESAGRLVLEVLDNGMGIPEKKILDPHSLGLLGMRERVMPFGGELLIKGVPGEGTTIRVVMPLERPPLGTIGAEQPGQEPQ